MTRPRGPGVLTEPAPAKVNLSLLVTGRRADGYHTLDSIAVFGPASDLVHARWATGLTLSLAGPFAAGLDAGEGNLVLRAARALAEAAGVAANAELVLEKHLPVASGIGGGSADAAATLRVLCRLWGVQPRVPVLQAMALRLGADVPVCLVSRPARMTGLGEVLAALPPVPRCGLLLVNPGEAVATADVFRARTGPFSPQPPAPQHWPDAAAMASALDSLGNDLEAAAIQLCPVITAVLTRLRACPGCLLTQMSGSGATCFGLFADPTQAADAAGHLPSVWWRAAGPLYEPPDAALFTGAGQWGVAKR